MKRNEKKKNIIKGLVKKCTGNEVQRELYIRKMDELGNEYKKKYSNTFCE